MFSPTTKMPVTTGVLGVFNVGAVSRNQMFAAWLEALVLAVDAVGMKISADYIPGGVNTFFTLPDTAWLLVDGFNIYCTQGHMTCPDIAADPVGWVKSQIKMQKAFGRVER